MPWLGSLGGKFTYLLTYQSSPLPRAESRVVRSQVSAVSLRSVHGRVSLGSLGSRAVRLAGGGLSRLPCSSPTGCPMGPSRGRRALVRVLGLGSRRASRRLVSGPLALVASHVHDTSRVRLQTLQSFIACVVFSSCSCHVSEVQRARRSRLRISRSISARSRARAAMSAAMPMYRAYLSFQQANAPRTQPRRREVHQTSVHTGT